MANLSGTLGTSTFSSWRELIHIGTVDLVGTRRWLCESVHYSDSVYSMM